MTSVVDVSQLKPDGARYFEDLTDRARVMFAWNGESDLLAVSAPFRGALVYLAGLRRFESEIVVPAQHALGDIQGVVDIRFCRSVILCPTVRFMKSCILIEDVALLRGYLFLDSTVEVIARPYAVRHLRSVFRRE